MNYFRTNAKLYFNGTLNLSNDNCHLFAAFNFTYVDNWPLYFNECAYDSNDFFFHKHVKRGGGTGANSDLLSTQCLKYNLLSGVNSCDCHMDCLLQFKLGRFSYIYLEGINCSETTFNDSLNIFKRSENLRSEFTQKNDYTNCSNTPGITSNLLQQGSHVNYFPLAPSSTSTLITQMETTTITLTTHKPSPFTSTTTFTSSPTPVPTS